MQFLVLGNDEENSQIATLVNSCELSVC